jgi:hypothetical protein
MDDCSSSLVIAPAATPAVNSAELRGDGKSSRRIVGCSAGLRMITRRNGGRAEKALGLVVPQALLASADEMVE